MLSPASRDPEAPETPMIERPDQNPASLDPLTIERHLREARLLRGTAIRGLFASASGIAIIAWAPTGDAVRARLHRRRPIFVPRLACR